MKGRKRGKEVKLEEKRRGEAHLHKMRSNYAEALRG